MSLMDNCANFNEVAPQEFGSANIMAFHGATMGTNAVTFNVNTAPAANIDAAPTANIDAAPQASDLQMG